jgi:hypothetical protein
LLRAQVGEGGCALVAGDCMGFWSQYAWVQGSVGAKAELLDVYAGWLRGAAESFERSDQG